MSCGEQGPGEAAGSDCSEVLHRGRRQLRGMLADYARERGMQVETGAVR